MQASKFIGAKLDIFWFIETSKFTGEYFKTVASGYLYFYKTIFFKSFSKFLYQKDFIFSYFWMPEHAIIPLWGDKIWV